MSEKFLTINPIQTNKQNKPHYLVCEKAGGMNSYGNVSVQKIMLLAFIYVINSEIIAKGVLP